MGSCFHVGAIIDIGPVSYTSCLSTIKDVSALYFKVVLYVGLGSVTIFVLFTTYTFCSMYELSSCLITKVGTLVLLCKFFRGINFFGMGFATRDGLSYTILKAIQIILGLGVFTLSLKVIYSGGLGELWGARYALYHFIGIVARAVLGGTMFGG